ncbi:MAG: ATP phosphoribosyltransferase regulatory subunit [Solirubrobacteraceae bacterium]
MSSTQAAGPGGPEVAIDRTPSGTRDVLPDEMRELRAMTDRLRGVFEAAGYGEVYTPALEYEQTFARVNVAGARPAYRVFDEHGSTLVLRPDMTVPIARLVATRYARAQPPLRFGYMAQVYRGVRPQRGQSREFLQAGIELVGSPGPAGTAEVLGVLCAALDAAGLENYRIGLGDASLHPTLLGALGVPAQRRELILAELAAGDFVGADRQIHALGLPDSDADLLLRVARARGGAEILDGQPPALHDALAGMRETHRLLPEAAAQRLIFDLGLVGRFGYYTGAVFGVFDPAHGRSLGGGGRYDELLGAFGRPLPAVGFGLNVERLHIALTGEERGRGR